MLGAEFGFDLGLRQVERGHDDVAGDFVADLDQIFAEVGFDDAEASVFQVGVEANFLRHHGLALGDELGIGIAADFQDDVAGIACRLSPMDLCAVLKRFLFIACKVDVEIGQHVVFDVAADVAELLELRQPGFGCGALGDEAARQATQCALQLGIAEGHAGVGFEIG